MNLIGITLTIALLLPILFFNRRWAAISIVVGVCYITQGQAFHVGGVTLFSIRILEMAGLIRIFAKREFDISKINSIDKAIFCFHAIFIGILIIRVILDPNTPVGLQYKIGLSCDSICSYIIFRGLIIDGLDFIQFSKDLVLIFLPFAIIMFIEGYTGNNIFSIMGGVPETPVFREGYYRCQASFRQAITAGSLGATLFPMIISLALSKRNIVYGVIGSLLCIAIVVLSHSSGPLSALLVGILAWLTWPFRSKMRTIRIIILCTIISLHIYMKQPVWFILDRISGVIGGDGWHRANLLDQFVKHYDQWIFKGMAWIDTGNWAATRMPWGAIDTTNEYVSLGINGGLIPLILFIYVLKKCYSAIGNSIIALEKERAEEKVKTIIIWSLGCTLTTHVVNLISVSYWDQFNVIWYMVLAMISSITSKYASVKYTEINIVA